MPLFHLRLRHTTDLLGRRSLKNGSLYGYNVRDEKISAEDTFYVHERKQDGDSATVLSSVIYTRPKRSSNACVFREVSQMPFANPLTCYSIFNAN